MSKLVVIDESIPQARRWRWTVLACRLAEALHVGMSVAEHVAAEVVRTTREGGRPPTRQQLARLMKRDDFKAKVDEQLALLKHEADLVRRGVQRQVEHEAVHAIRKQIRREIAGDDGDVTSVARLALEYAGVVGKNVAPAVNVDVDARTEVNLASLTTPELVTRWRASVDAAERALTAPPDVDDTARVAPSEEAKDGDSTA